MPPKNAKAKVAKIVEDKTFGMKNKNKSKKVQQFIQTVEKTASHNLGKDLEEERRRFQAKKEAEKKQAEEDFLMGNSQQLKKLQREAARKKQLEDEAAKKKAEEDAAAAAKAAAEVDPKTILCENFMKGLCMEGDNCKYSHDDAKARKSAKLSLYQDPREKLVPGFKFRTEKVCQKFLDAVESSKYGHFWVCPNGGDKCIFRHCLPFGFVLKRDIKLADADVEELDIAEQIEIERSRLDISKCTPVTEERLKEWMVTRKAQRDAEIEAERQEKLKKAGTTKGSVLLNGRSLFQLDPSLFKDDEGALDDAELVIEKGTTAEEPEEEDRGVADDLADAVEALTLEDGTEVDTSLFE